MRFWNIGSPIPTEGLDPMVLDLYGPGAPPEIEEAAWDLIGDAYCQRLDGMGAYRAVFPEPEEDEDGEGSGAGRRAAAPRRPPPRSRPPRPSPAPARCATASRPSWTRTTTRWTRSRSWSWSDADGGREVKLGSVRNTLTAIRN